MFNAQVHNDVYHWTVAVDHRIGGNVEDSRGCWMKNMMMSVLKWWLIIAFAAVSFYLVYPKYVPHPKASRFVVNTITGEIEKRN